MTIGILFSLKRMESLENGLQIKRAADGNGGVDTKSGLEPFNTRFDSK